MKVKLAAGEPFDDEHDAGACWTAQAWLLGWIGAWRSAEQHATTFKHSTSSAVGKESEVTNAHQAAGQNMQQEAAQELRGGNCHNLLLAAVRIVSPAERDAIVFKGHEPVVGNGNAMGVSGQVVEHMFGAAEGWLGVDHPVLPKKLPEEVAECAWRGKMLL